MSAIIFGSKKSLMRITNKLIDSNISNIIFLIRVKMRLTFQYSHSCLLCTFSFWEVTHMNLRILKACSLKQKQVPFQ